MVAIFSIPAFFIVLREVLEACLVVGIILAYLSKIGATQYRKWVWIGAIGGIVSSVAVGLAFGIFFWVRGEQLFTDKAEKTFEGIVFLIAAALLTWMIIWMMFMGKEMQSSLEDKIESIVESGKSTSRRKANIFLIVYVQILREGIETIIFLIGTSSADSVGGWRAIPLPGILGLLVGIALSYLLFNGLVNLDIASFLRYSGILLIAFAAGLVSHAFHELQEIDLFGPWSPTETRDWYNFPLWNTEDCCDDGSKNEFFAMLRALFGYQDKPTFIEWSTYFAYWIIVIVIFIVVNWGFIRASRTKTASYTQLLTPICLLFTFVGWVFSLINRTWIGIFSMSVGLLVSLIAIISVFDAIALSHKVISSKRRILAMGAGVCLGLLTTFMIILHLIEMECIGREECEMGLFFFFGIIYNMDFLALGRQESSWPPLAALSFSIVLTAFFFGATSFLLIIYSFNVDSDGNYLDDNAVPLKADDIEENGNVVDSA